MLTVINYFCFSLKALVNEPLIPLYDEFAASHQALIS